MYYKYEAVDKEGTVVQGEFEAKNKSAIIDYLEKQHLVPLAIELKKDESVINAASILSFNLFEKITAIDQIALTRNLAAAIGAGLSIIEAVNIMIADATKTLMRKILIQAKTNLENGQPLWMTFSGFKNYFPVIFVGLIKAGEASGRLDGALTELSRHLIREYGLVRKIKSALAYPILLLIASAGVIILLMTFVLPRLTKVFGQSKIELPLITKIIIGVSGFFAANIFIILPIILFLTGFFVYFRKTETGSRIFLKIIFRIPVARELIKKIALVRFSRTLGGLIASGVSILEALTLTADSVANFYYKQAILESIEQIKNGVSFSRTLNNHPELFPKFLISLTTVGERTGTLENVLKNFSDFYDEETDHAIKNLTSFLEPLLILIMGLLVAAIAFSILFPIYRLIGKFV